VKTYPHPCERYDDLVCTAGITEDGEWIRLYPINYRGLDPRRELLPYQWVEVMLEAEGHGGDPRPESRRPNLETLEVCGEPLSAKDNWRARKDFVDRLPVCSMGALIAQGGSEHRSLGVVRPARVYDIEVNKVAREWSPQQLELMDELGLFDSSGRYFRKLPFEFYYLFDCKGDLRPHRSLITDWELGAFYLKEERRLGDGTAAAQSVKDRFLNALCGRSMDTLFFMGSVRRGKSWNTLGVFHPERESQLSLLE